jgi:hypothetical protein
LPNSRQISVTHGAMPDTYAIGVDTLNETPPSLEVTAGTPD